MNKYVGHENQTCGVEKIVLSGGKAEGLKMLNIRNGKGLEFWISVDRAGDIARLSFKGDNYGYLSACGFVSPQYYDCNGDGFLKSFTSGFFTTCGLNAVGAPCNDNGEDLPLHGTFSNIPCENVNYWTDDEGIHIKAIIRDARLFSYKFIVEREYLISTDKNEILLTDTIKNIGSVEAPLEVLYHCNFAYPLLSEKAKLTIPSKVVVPRSEHAKEGIDTWNQCEVPQRGYEEMCFYHTMEGKPTVELYNPDIKKGIKLHFDTNELKCFTQWKMMGEYDYVMGLEPGNCLPDGRDVMRKEGILEFLKPDEVKVHHIRFEFTEE